MCSLNLDELKLECNSNANNYPKTLLFTPEYSHRLEESSRLLKEKQDDLCSLEDDLRLWERESFHQTEGRKTRLESIKDTRKHFGINPGIIKEDPLIRFMCVVPSYRTEVR